ncbi:MAG: hypothetical protein AAB955_02630 [Patescibacteria group bacterium]
MGFGESVKLASAEPISRSVEVPLEDPNEIAWGICKDGIVFVYFRLISDQLGFVRRVKQVPVPKGYSFSSAGRYNEAGIAVIVDFYKDEI